MPGPSSSISIDAMTRATPLAEIKRGAASSLSDLFFGNVAGSLGETSALLIILGGIFIIYKKAASWRLALSCLVGGILISSALRGAGVSDVASLVSPLLSGSFLFGSAFVVTEPISGPKTHWGQWAYGFMIGGLTMIFREYSNFMEGFMFAVILMNAFVPILDYMVRRLQGPKKVSA